MKSAVACLSLVGAAIAGGVTDHIAPKDSYPAQCSKEFPSQMEITISAVSKVKRNLITRGGDCGSDGTLVMNLKDGILTDAKGRTGYIASNYQFQFDGPPQAGALFTAGFSVCDNNTLALGSGTTWYQCKSGAFWNLYDRNWAAQCTAVELIAMPCGANAPGSGAEIGDGQIVATQLITTTVVKPISDGQPQVITTAVPVPICQIGDGQIQGHTTPCASITPAATPATTAAPVSQFSDGQIQVTKAASASAGPAGSATKPKATPSGSKPALSGTNSTAVKSAASVTATTQAAPPASTSAPAVAASGALLTTVSSLGPLAIALAAAFLAL